MEQWFSSFIFWPDEDDEAQFSKQINNLFDEIENFRYSNSRIWESQGTYFYSCGGVSNRKGVNFDFDFELFKKIVEISCNESHGYFYSINQDVEDVYNLWVGKKGEITKLEDVFFSPYQKELL